LTLVPFCWASRKVCILWRVLDGSDQYEHKDYEPCQALCESPDMLQHHWWQSSARIWLDVNNDNCIKQVVHFFHQVNAVSLVLFDSLKGWTEIQGDSQVYWGKLPQCISRETVLCYK
jgi:hypothetical protein